MHQILKLKLIGTFQGLVPAPAVASNTLEGIDEIIQLLREAGFVAGAFDAKKRLECEQSQVIHACHLLYENFYSYMLM